MAEHNNSRLLDGGDDSMGMTDNQYKGMLLDQQEKVEKQIRKINEKLKF